MRALASHQRVPDTIPGPDIICGLSLLLVLYSAFRLSQTNKQTNIFKFKFDPGMHERAPCKSLVLRMYSNYKFRFIIIFLFN